MPTEPKPDRTPEALRELLGKTIVVDTDSHYMYLGVLIAADAQYLTLSDVDVHEVTAATLSKERYAHEARQIGVRKNRDATWINLGRVISISRLEDIEAF
ncbi:MAG: hypothetical protein KIS92_19190 [Planctomycetota bacterium]|nr:hypothetical protein [Planctomycetota bacterium]